MANRRLSETSNSGSGIIEIHLPEIGTDKTQSDKHDKTLQGAHLFGIVYALVIVVLGAIFPLSEALHDQWLYTWYTAGFSVYILVVASATLIFAQFCMGHTHEGAHDHGHDNPALSQDAGSLSNPAISHHPNPDTTVNGVSPPNGMVSRGSSAMIRRNPSSEMFDNIHQTPVNHSNERDATTTAAWVDLSKLGNIFSHEGSSLYLRFGALVFGLGNFIYLCLELEANYGDHECDTPPYSWIFVFRLLFLLVQTFFIFKNPHVHVVRHHTIVRMGFMHVIATNLCVWMRTLTEEILHEYHHLPHDETPDSGSNVTKIGVRVADDCIPDTVITTAGPYLFAFVLEYSLIAMGTFTIMYVDVGHDEVKSIVRGIKNYMKVKIPMGQNAPSSQGQDSHGSHRPMGFAKSHRGVFGGIVFLALSIVCVVLFYYYIGNDEAKANRVYFVSDIILHFFILVATLVVLFNIRSFSFIPKPASVDDVLLLVGFIGYLLVEAAIIVGCSSYLSNPDRYIDDISSHQLSTQQLRAAAEVPQLSKDEIDERIIMGLVSGLISLCSAVAQVFLVLVGLRCYCTTSDLLKRAPGRGIIAFLVVSNVAMWVFRTSQVKQVSFGVSGVTFGDLAWLLIMNISLPLLLFFHFHASVCFADIWHTAYEPLPLQKTHARAEKHVLSRASSMEEGNFESDPTSNEDFKFDLGGQPATFNSIKTSL